MKLDSILIILTLNAIFWSLINSVKNNKEQNELSGAGETSKNNDGAESSANAQIQMLKPKPKISKKDRTTINNKEKRNRSEYMRIYRQKNREKRREYGRKYYQDNKEKKREYNRKYREKMKNKKENLRNVDPKVGDIHSDNEGTSFVTTQKVDFRNKGKLPIVYEESIQFEEGNLFNQEEEECTKGETETYMEEQNQTVVEEPTNINYINQIDSDEEDEEDYLRYLNDKPEDEDEDV